MSGSVAPKTIETDRGVAVAGVRVNVDSLTQAISEIIDRAKHGRGFTLFTLNLDHVVKLRWSGEFRAAYRRANFVTADGWPVAWLANRAAPQQQGAIERTTGADLVEPLCEVAARRGVPLYLVGPGEHAQAAAIATLRRRYPGLRIVGAEAPPPGATEQQLYRFALARRIAASHARICLVSLGAPKQELLADALAARCPDIGFVCVGAALDFVADKARRAPQWVQRGGFEWLWRLAHEPRRLAARYAACAYVLVLLGLGLSVVPQEEYP